ncbi:putative N terminus of Rad21 / Rec8 like protein [Blattamonas nauphoetae]|uniref:N terminus of Rad21 / Rec8 like protein n=1 Tax=Blattamonas nauphoetae TaxID=2049346 RepID=A0ABQ9YMC0_9EUKA|nr:putative N terminus of Rad21 / Rec8 like protein [Blattamonas nauphoetae]
MALYSRYISKHGPLGQVWIAANYDRNLSKGKILQINIPAAVKIIREGIPTEENPKKKIPLPLRYQAHLLLGLIRVYTRKLKYLADDINEFQSRLNTTLQTSNIDLPPNVGNASRSHITIPDTPLNMSTPRDPTLNIFGYPRPSLLMPDPTLTDPESLRSSLSPFTLPSNMLRTPMTDGSDFRESDYFAGAADNLMSDIPTVFVTPTNDPDEIRWLIEYAHQQGGYQDFDTFMQTTEFYNQRPSEYNHPDSSSLAFQPTTTPEMQEGFEYPEPQAQEKSNKIPLFLEDDLATLKSSTGKKKRKQSGPPVESDSSQKKGVIIDQVITLSDQTMSDNQDDTRDIVRRMEMSQMIIFPSLSNWSDDDLIVPPTDEFMEEWKKQIHFDPAAYLERLKAIKSKTYLAAPPVQIEPPVSQTVRTDAEDALAKAEGKTTKENTPSTDSLAPLEEAARRATTHSTPNTTAGFDGVFEEFQSPGPFEGHGAMDEFVTPQSRTSTEGQPEGMWTDETVRDLHSRILACNSPDFNSITNSPHHTMAPSRPLGSTSEPPLPYSDSKTRDMLELVAYQFNKENKIELPFEKAFKCPQPEKNAPEHLKREWRRSKALAMAALLTFVRDGYVKSKQAAPYAPIFVEITNRLQSVKFEKKSTRTHNLPTVTKL